MNHDKLFNTALAASALLFFTGMAGCVADPRDEDEGEDLGEAASAVDAYQSYSGAWAAQYAVNNYSRAYGSSSGQNPFTNYNWVPNGGNCTNFVSQAILGGLAKSSSASVVFSKRYDFDSDAGSQYSWYFHNDGDRSPSFTGAPKLLEYAKTNKSTYKGLHFTFVTKDTLQVALDYNAVKVGDVVFADWQHDGIIDHTMLVTAYDTSKSGYNRIRLTYQTTNTTNKGLGDLNSQYQMQALFTVYRPVDYNPNGL